MKKNFLFMSVLATLLMAGCSKEESAPNGGDDGNGEANTSYLAVNLVSSDVTRAASGYKDGSEEENYVENVRFYFFTANGEIANVKLLGSTYVNYYDWTPNQTEDDKDQSQGTIDTDDIESKLKATIVISTASGDKLPQRIAAVLNPTGLDNESKSLEQLKAITNDYVTGLTSKGKFVMFNSVYKDGESAISTAPITTSNLGKTEAEAKDHPVVMYVERSVARVDVKLGTDVAAATTDAGLKLKDKNGNDLKVEAADGTEKQVYLKLEGWSLTADTDHGRLVKAINPKWTQSWAFGSTYRSFWAINSPDANNQYHKYSDIKSVIGTSLYTNENALSYSQTKELKHTKVILKGTIQDADKKPLTIVRHLGFHFIDDANLTRLRNNILNKLKASNKSYYFEKDGGREQIGIGDLKIVIATQQEIEESKNNCYVYAQLTDDAKNKTWYTTLSGGSAIDNADKVINKDLSDKEIVDWALVWNTGMTYYYYDIIHNGSGENATKGVVRNHIYDTTVTKIAGLGTPVYNPEKDIYPEKPNPNDHYIAAEVKILSWRIVSNDYELEW